MLVSLHFVLRFKRPLLMPDFVHRKCGIFSNEVCRNPLYQLITNCFGTITCPQFSETLKINCHIWSLYSWPCLKELMSLKCFFVWSFLSNIFLFITQILNLTKCQKYIFESVKGGGEAVKNWMETSAEEMEIRGPAIPNIACYYYATKIKVSRFV